MTELTNSGKKKVIRPTKHVRTDKGHKRVGMEEIFRMYPYKTQDWDGSGAVPFPYVPKDEITEGPYSVTWKEYRAIMSCYFKYLIRYLMQGYMYRIPWGMGFFSLVKKKRPRPDMFEMNEARARGEIIPYVSRYRRASDGYSVMLAWTRGKQTTVRFKWNSFYRITLERPVHQGIINAVHHDRSILYRFKDSSYV